LQSSSVANILSNEARFCMSGYSVEQMN
jgi:hypothetical protein